MSSLYEFKAQTILEEGRTTQAAINEIGIWLPTIGFPNLPEELIVIFLISCENNILATQKTIMAYFRIKNAAPDMFDNRDILNEDLKKTMDVITAVSIPERMENNVIIHFFKLKDTNYKNVHLTQISKIAYMLLDISQRRNPPNELVVVIDMKNIGIMHLTRLKMTTLKIFFEFLQEAMPLKIKQIHILNTNYIFHKALAIAKIFIKVELLDLINTHPPSINMEQFFKEHIPQRHFPEEYGGDLPHSDILNELTCKYFQELKPFFDAEEKLRKSN